MPGIYSRNPNTKTRMTIPLDAMNVIDFTSGVIMGESARML
jgi:hypothetical protein